MHQHATNAVHPAASQHAVFSLDVFRSSCFWPRWYNDLMNCLVNTAGAALAIFVISLSAQAQSGSPTPAPELRKLDMWIGDWTLTGTAKDGPKAQEYKVEWHLHEHWTLNGFFLQADQTWKSNGEELHSIEILSYDPFKRIYFGSGFSSEGTSWALTAKFEDTILRENVAGRGPRGEFSRCRIAWQFSNEGNSLAGTEQCTQNFATWTAFNVVGTKTKPTKE
jgi:hypothetical protein